MFCKYCSFRERDVLVLSLVLSEWVLRGETHTIVEHCCWVAHRAVGRKPVEALGLDEEH